MSDPIEERRNPPAYDIRAEVQAGVIAGMNQVLTNHDTMKAFWGAGYEQLTGHAADGASKWVGRRVLTWIATTALTVAVGYLLAQSVIPGMKK